MQNALERARAPTVTGTPKFTFSVAAMFLIAPSG
jgi:hypothetical protein